MTLELWYAYLSKLNWEGAMKSTKYHLRYNVGE